MYLLELVLLRLMEFLQYSKFCCPQWGVSGTSSFNEIFDWINVVRGPGSTITFLSEASLTGHPWAHHVPKCCYGCLCVGKPHVFGRKIPNQASPVLVLSLLEQQQFQGAEGRAMNKRGYSRNPCLKPHPDFSFCFSLAPSRDWFYRGKNCISDF